MRLSALKNWLQQALAPDPFQINPINNDASFRSYYRIKTNQHSYIAMDAPPEKEDCKPFIAIAQSFRNQGIHTPEIYASNPEHGFLLMSDFGDQSYLSVLTPQSADTLYQHAFDQLHLIQSCKKITNYTLPHFDDPLYRSEFNLFQEWFLKQHHKLAISDAEHTVLNTLINHLIESALSQPQVCVHRDYHSRNLMFINKHNVGVLDFQDALQGPITYDVVSLLRDCYIDWPAEHVTQWALDFQTQLLKANRLENDDPKQFLRWFDWMGLQRHLKCVGIFARLNKRDNKPEYLQHIPRLFKYIQSICERYPEFSDFAQFLKNRFHGGALT